MKAPSVHGIYCWKAQDIPEPDPEGGPIDTEVLLEGKRMIEEAMNRLLEDLDNEFCIAPYHIPSEFSVTSALGKIDREVGRIRSVMLAIKRELGRRVALLSKRRNAMVPFGKLPVELVGSMLTYVTTVSPRPLSYPATAHEYAPISKLKELATVSVGWWHAIRSSPTVWTTIGAESDYVVAFKIRKSGSLPLHIVTCPDHPQRANFIGLVAANRNQLGSIHLDLKSTTVGGLVRRLLRASPPRLESLKLEWGHLYEEHSPLELGEGKMLRHLHLEGIMPNLDSPALRNITHLTLAGLMGIRAGDIYAVLALTINIESLTLHHVGDSTYEGFDSTGSPVPMEIPTLERLIIDRPESRLCIALLDGIHANRLSYLLVKWEPLFPDAMATIFLRPNGQVHGSILSTVIVNSCTEIVHMTIEDRFDLKLTGLGSRKEVTFCISVCDSQWHQPATSEQFSTFASSLPPVRITFSSTETSLDNGICFPWSLSFIHSMPSIISIVIIGRGDLAGRLFRDVLADEHAAGQEWRWACPKLTEVWIGRKAQDQDYKSSVHEVLKRRNEAVRDEPLPRISVWFEGEDGYWMKLPADVPDVDRSWGQDGSRSDTRRWMNPGVTLWVDTSKVAE